MRTARIRGEVVLRTTQWVSLSVLGLLATGEGGAAPAQPPASEKSEPPAEAPPAVDPEAVAALERMGAFLREQKSLEIKGETLTDEVLESGQKVQFGAAVDIKVRKPDRLRVEVDSDRKSRQFIFDGTTFTIFGPRAGYFAQVPARGTIRELVEEVGHRYGIDLPLADLFYWGTDKSGVSDIRSAIYLGPSTIAGAKCDQYAFRQSDVDWQIWIQQGAQPLPRRLIITSVTERAQPQHEAFMNWTLNPTFADQLFTFVPPSGALPIRLEDLAAQSGRSRQGRAGRR
jgi:hypothetical protein